MRSDVSYDEMGDFGLPPTFEKHVIYKTQLNDLLQFKLWGTILKIKFQRNYRYYQDFID
jgi:hypothetical protein